MSEYTDLARLVTFRPLERPVDVGGRVSPFSAKWSSTVVLLTRELRAHGSRDAVMEVDFREQDLRLDTLPRGDRRARTPGIVLFFTATSVSASPVLRYEVGTYTDWRDNVRAIALGLEALRAVDRYGVTRRGEQYAGWRALPAGPAPSAGRGAEIVRKLGGVAAALRATHPDTRADGYTDIDFESVQAHRASAE